LIREEYGLRITVFVMLGLVITTSGTLSLSSAGIAGSMELFGLSKYITVPVCALIVWLLVIKGAQKTWKRFSSRARSSTSPTLPQVCLAHPNWKHSLLATVTPPTLASFKEKGAVFTVIGLVGTTIAPWMQFYLQASIVEKGVTKRQYAASRLDVIVGCIFTDVVAWFIIVACAATLYVNGFHNIRDAKDAAEALRPLAGQFAFILFALGLFNAALFPRPSCPFPRSIRFARGLASSPVWTINSAKRRSSTGSTRCCWCWGRASF